MNAGQNYIYVGLRTDEDCLMGSNGWGGYDGRASVQAYRDAVEAAIIDAFPGVEVDVTTDAARRTVATDIDGVTDDDMAVIIGDITERVWQSWGWLRE